MQGSDQTEYTTWVDFTKRMQGTTISQYDWALFYNRYRGFIHDRCVKCGWVRYEQEIVDRCVLKFTDEEIKKIRHERPGAFRAWLFKVIKNAYLDVISSRIAARKKDVMTSALSIDREEDIREERDDEKEVKGAAGLLDERGENDKFRFWTDPIDYQINDRKLSDDDLWHCYVAYIVFDLIEKNTSPEQYQVFVWRECKKRTIEEIVQATGCTKEQVYEYSRAVKVKLRNQFKKFGEMPQDLSSDDWASLLQKAKTGYDHYRKIADEVSTRYTGKI
jgi:RNA polymerase sigma factor (sigma-70 family)